MNFSNEEFKPFLDGIANQAYFQCFKRVFKQRVDVKASEKQDLQMELCLFNYLHTYQEVVRSANAYISDIKLNP